MSDNIKTMRDEGRRRVYDKALIEQVAHHILVEQMTVGETSKLTGIPYSTIKDWVNRYKRNRENVYYSSGNLKAENNEIHRLRKENIELKEKNETLKEENKSLEKSVFILAKNQK